MDMLFMEGIDEKHRGMKVKQTLINKGVDMGVLAKRVNLFEEHLHVLFSDRFLDYDLIKFIGYKAGHDFSQEFPEMEQQAALSKSLIFKADAPDMP